MLQLEQLLRLALVAMRHDVVQIQGLEAEHVTIVNKYHFTFHEWRFPAVSLSTKVFDLLGGALLTDSSSDSSLHSACRH